MPLSFKLILGFLSMFFLYSNFNLKLYLKRENHLSFLGSKDNMRFSWGPSALLPRHSSSRSPQGGWSWGSSAGQSGRGPLLCPVSRSPQLSLTSAHRDLHCPLGQQLSRHHGLDTAVLSSACSHFLKMNLVACMSIVQSPSKFTTVIQSCSNLATDAWSLGFSQLLLACQMPNCWDFQTLRCQMPNSQ